MKFLFSLAFCFLLLQITVQIGNRLQRKHTSVSSTSSKVILEGVRRILSATEIEEVRKDAKISSQSLPPYADTLANVLKKIKESEGGRLKSLIDLAYSSFCTRAAANEGFRWVGLKAEASQSGEPDVFMIPFLRFREVANIVVLAMAVQNTFFKEGFMNSHCPSKTVATTAIVETKASVIEILTSEKTPKIQNLCSRHATDFFKATASLQTNANLKIALPGGDVKIYNGLELMLTAMAAGSVTTFSDIDQTISSAAATTPQQFLYYQCLQAEVVRAFDSYFEAFFENSSFDTFDLNAYVNGFFELEVKEQDFTSTNCQTRVNSQHYSKLNNMVSLFGLHNLLHHLSGGEHEREATGALQGIINFNKEKEDIRSGNYMFFATINIEESSFMKESIKNHLAISETDANAKVFTRLADDFARKTDEQKTIYLRNIMYYLCIKAANEEFQRAFIAHPPQAGDNYKEYIGRTAYNNKEYLKKVLLSVFYTNEAVFTGGSLMHVLGGQLKTKKGFENAVWSFRDFDVVQSFYLNIGFAMDHFLHFFYHFMSETNAEKKKYYLWEGIMKLAKYSKRAFAALNFKFYKVCPRGEETDLISQQRVEIPNNVHDFNDFMVEAINLKDRKEVNLPTRMNDLLVKYNKYIKEKLLIPDNTEDLQKQRLFLKKVFKILLDFITAANIGGMARNVAP